MKPGRCVDTGDPQSSKISLFNPSISIRRDESSVNGIHRRSVKPTSPSDIAFRHFKNLLPSPPRLWPTFYPWHFEYSSGENLIFVILWRFENPSLPPFAKGRRCLPPPLKKGDRGGFYGDSFNFFGF
jgi:hypothetical protein